METFSLWPVITNDEISYIEYLDDRGFISSRIYYNEGKPLFPRVSEFWWAMGFERDVDRREPLRHGQWSFLSCLQKESYANMGEVVAEKMKEQLATLVPGRDQLVLAAHPANLAFYKIRQVASRKSCLSMGIVSLVCRKLCPLFWYDWCPALDYR